VILQGVLVLGVLLGERRGGCAPLLHAMAAEAVAVPPPDDQRSANRTCWACDVRIGSRWSTSRAPQST